MTLLFLGYNKNRIIDFLRNREERVVFEDKKLNLRELQKINPNYIISYGYRHIITPDIIKEYPEIVNLHIAYLPWNRGVNPCFWSLLENTPPGYTLHYIDEGIDTGDVLIQDKMKFKRDETIGRIYEQLKQGIEDLFIDSWQKIAGGKIAPKQQAHKGTYHEHKDLEPYKFLLDDELEKGAASAKRISKYGREHNLWFFDEKG